METLGPLGSIVALPLAAIAKTWIEEAWIKDVLDQPNYRGDRNDSTKPMHGEGC